MPTPLAISGKGGSVKANTVEYPMKDWSATFETDVVTVTNFMSRSSDFTCGSNAYARQQVISGISRINVECSGYSDGTETAFCEGAVVTLALGIAGGATPSSSLALSLVNTSAVTVPLAFRITNVSYTNDVTGALEWNFSATSLTSVDP